LGAQSPIEEEGFLPNIVRWGALWVIVAILTSAAIPATVLATYADRRASPLVVAYHIDADQESLTTLLTHGDQIHWVITTNFAIIDSSGRLDGVHNPALVEVVHRLGSEVHFRVANFVRRDWSRKVAHAVVTQPSSRRMAITQILHALDAYGYDGVNLDLENVPPEDRVSLSTFVGDVSDAVHARGKTVTIAVPATTHDVPENSWAGAFDLATLGRLCDAVIVMAYDQHWSTSAPGPVAALPWVEDVIRYAAGEVGRHKVLLGLAFYGYDWPQRGRGVGVSMREAMKRALRRKAQVRWDQDARVPYFTTTTRTVYFENARSIEHKLDLATRYGLAGIAAWRLGQELDDVWDAVSAYAGSRPAAVRPSR
jgi:spore germination protein YaaH